MLALICTGFHRSGTSLAAKRLARAGLSLGTRLVPAHPSNPDGHYEDAAAVERAVAWLRRQGTDWLHHDTTPLAADGRLHEDLRAYVATRDAAGAPWALKDPRLCLGLDAWDAVLGERGRYLLMVRHWGECAQSLFHRHSREMAHHLLPPSNPNFRFWTDPNAVYASWLAYNRRLVDFAAARTDQVAIVTARAMAETRSLSPLVEGRLGVPLAHPDADPGLRPQLLSRDVAVAMLPPPPLWLRRSLDAMWGDLVALADRRGAREDVVWDARGLGPALQAQIDRVVGDRFPDALRPAVAAPEPPPVEATPAEPARIRALLAAVPPAQRTRRALSAARRQLAAGQHDDAIRVIDDAIALGAQAYPLQLLRGDVAMARGLPEVALSEYRAALAGRVTEQGVMKAVRCLMALRRWREAIDLLEPLLAQSPGHADANVALARCLDGLGAPDLAALRLAGAPAGELALMNLRAQMTLAFDVPGGMEQYLEVVRQRLAGRDLVDWLATACAALPVAAAWSAFVEGVVRHWDEAIGRDEVLARLGIAAPVRPPAANASAPRH